MNIRPHSRVYYNSKFRDNSKLNNNICVGSKRLFNSDLQTNKQCVIPKKRLGFYSKTNAVGSNYSVHSSNVSYVPSTNFNARTVYHSPSFAPSVSYRSTVTPRLPYSSKVVNSTPSLQYSRRQHSSNTVESFAVGSAGEGNNIECLKEKNSAYINVRVSGVHTSILLDSGSRYNIMSLEFAKKIKANICPNSMNNNLGQTPKCLISVSGDRMSVIGKCRVSVTFDGLPVITEFLILDDVFQKVLLGLNSFQAMKTILDFDEGFAYFFNKKIQIPFNNDFSKEKNIYTVNNVVLQPFSQKTVLVSTPKCFSNQTVNISPSFSSDTQMYCVAKSINVISNKSRTIACFINPTAECINIPARKAVGKISVFRDKICGVYDDGLKKFTLCDSKTNKLINHKTKLGERQEYLRFVHEFFHNSKGLIETDTNLSMNNHGFVDVDTNQSEIKHQGGSQNNCFQNKYEVNTSVSQNNQTQLKHQGGSQYKFKDLNISADHLPEAEKLQFIQLIDRYGDCFAKNLSDLNQPCKYPPMHIQLKPDAKPVRQKPYKTTIEASREIDRQVNELLKHDLIEPSVSPWSSPVILVKKPNNTHRLCIDLRRCNEMVSDLSYTMPEMSDVIDLMSEKECKYLTKLDLTSGFFQFALDQESKDITTFVTSKNNWKFKRLPFGLKSSPILFQLAMSEIFRACLNKHALIYIDDVITVSSDFDSHIKNLTEIFEILRSTNLKLNPEKCEFMKAQITYLGYLVSGKQISIDPKKLSVISQQKPPSNQKELKGFLGYTGFFRRLVRGYSQITVPFQNLLRKDTKFIWKPEHEDAFQRLKAALLAEPVLSFYRSDREIHLTTDACSRSIGYIITQPG